jgi:tetratricopeptide (TPR) repeat protein
MRPPGLVLGLGLALACLAAPTPAPSLTGPQVAAGSPAQEDAPADAGSARTNPDFERLAKAADEARGAGRLEGAIRLYREALDSDPSWTEGRWALGTILYTLERFGEAKTAFQGVVAVEPEHGISWAFKGLCEFELRDYERALGDLQHAEGLGVGHKAIAPVATYHLAILLARYQQFELSLEKLAELARQGYESPSLTEALGLAALRLPYLPSEIPPEKREMLLMAGRATNHWANSRRTAAQRGFEELLLRYPEQRNIHYAFGVFLLKEDQDAALEQFERELRLSPFHVEAMLQIAIEKNLRAENEEALSMAEKAVELAPTLPAARNVLGRILLEVGNTDRAIQELEEGVKIAPEHRQMHFELERAYKRAGRKEDAERARAEFARLDEAERARARDQALSRTNLGREEEPRE